MLQESIRNRLQDNTGLIAKYNKIKTSFSTDILEILQGPTIPIEQQKVTINNDLVIFIDNKGLKPYNLKLIQSILQDRNFERKCQIKWDTALNQSFNWKQIWLLNLEIPLSSEKKEFQWKIIHNAILTEHKLFLMNMSDDGLCHFCKSNIEALAHLFFYCRRTNWILHELELKINRFLEDDSKPAIKIAPYHILSGLSTKIVLSEFLLTLLSC